MNKMTTFIEMVDVPTKLHLQQLKDTEGLAEYRALRTELEDEYEVWELIKKYPDELGFVLQEKDYAMYCDTFNYEGTGDIGDIVLTEEQFNKIKNFFSKGE